MASKHTVSPAGEGGAGGRGARVDGEQTRARIIETAGQLMAENGFAQTTSKRICETANINMAAINYHFGSREGLYLAVLEDMHNRIIDREFLDNLAGEAIPAREKMQRIENCIHCNHCANHCPYGLDTPRLLAANYEDYKTFLK